MEVEIHSVTSSEWKSVHRRLGDLENMVKDLKLKLDRQDQIQNRDSNLETQNFEETVEGVGVELNNQSIPTFAGGAPRTGDLPGQATIEEEQQEQWDEALILTSAERNSNSFNSTGTNCSNNNSTASTSISVKTTHKEILASASSTFTASLPDITGLEGQYNFEKSRRAVILLKRCDEMGVQESSSGSSSSDASEPTTSRSVNHGGRFLSKERKVHHGERKGQSGIRSAMSRSVKTEDICHYSRKCTKKQVLRTHMRSHAGEKPFHCDYCSKKFSQKSNLTSHLRVHTGMKPYECEHCSKKFSHRMTLTIHTRVHTGVKPYECQFCPRKFSDRSSVSSHLKSHTGEKPHSCPWCPRTFAHKTSFQAHVNSHTGEKPYQCKLCPRRFSTFSNMKAHLIVHTREQPYNCMFCPKTFKSNSALKQHLRGHTRGRPLPGVQEESPYPRSHFISTKSHSSQDTTLSSL